MIPVADYARSIRYIQRLGGALPPGLEIRSPAFCAGECNWIGSDDPSSKWASDALNTFLPWMKPASVPHDCWWSRYLFNDGTRAHFLRSNDEFRDNLDLIAEDSFRAVYPSILRRKFRDARHWEADKARRVLMSDMCWEIWQRNAEIEPGPEVMA